MFEELGQPIREEVVLTLFHAELTPEDADEVLQHGRRRPATAALSYEHESLAGRGGDRRGRRRRDGDGGARGRRVGRDAAQVVKAEHESVGRNDPCWCGSGKKYKSATARSRSAMLCTSSFLSRDRRCAHAATSVPSSRGPRLARAVGCTRGVRAEARRL